MFLLPPPDLRPPPLFLVMQYAHHLLEEDLVGRSRVLAARTLLVLTALTLSLTVAAPTVVKITATTLNIAVIIRIIGI